MSGGREPVTVFVGEPDPRPPRLERRLHAAIPCLVCAAGLAAIGLFERNATVSFLALAIATAGPVSAGAAFWQFPSMLLTGTAAAADIALINSFGSVSGWGAPFVIGWLRDLTGRTAMGFFVVAGLEFLAGALILWFMPRSSRAAQPALGQSVTGG